jgi:hypothetical protein
MIFTDSPPGTLTLDLTALPERPLPALTMGLHFLEDFPREIRDAIYFHVLVSPTGLVNLVVRWDDKDKPIPGRLRIQPHAKDGDPVKLRKQAINLSLLRTCKQIHEEAKNLFWEQNKIHLFGPGQLLGSFQGLDVGLSLKIRYLEIDIDVRTIAVVKQISEALETLGRWSREGNLKEVTIALVVRNPSQVASRVVESLLDLRSHSRSRLMYQDFLTVLKEAGGNDGYLTKVMRRIVFDAYWRRGRSLPKHWQLGIECKNPMPVVKDIHDAFGGEFWMDGLRVFKDQVEVNDLLRRNRLGKLMSPEERRH